MASKPPVPKSKTPGTAMVSYQDRLAALAKQATHQEASVASGSFISFKAGQLAYQGNPIKGNELDVVAVDSVLENCFYESEYDPDTPQPPVCYAFAREEEELRPHEKSSHPQHETCKGCPHNEFNTAAKGKGKACKNTRRIAVLPAMPLEQGALEKAEVAYMKLPVTSVKGWAAYVRGLSTLEQLPPLAVVTTISTVPDKDTQFKVVFQKKSNIDNDLMPAILTRYDGISEEIMFPYPEPTEQAPKPAKGKAKPAPAKGRKY